LIYRLDSSNQMSSNGSMQKMIESMKKEIDKRFLKGIAASPGIVIGKADEPMNMK